jgi:hypothetical protein
MNRVIIGDIHSCAGELQQIINHFPNCEYIAVGDLFDRGRRGMEVWNLIHKHNIKCCLGNHELKLLNFLTGKRDYISPHYHVFINAFKKEKKISELIEFLESLPLIIKLDETSLVTHAAVDLYNPWREDVSINVYGRYEKKKIEQWWNLYKGEVKVYYGHVSFNSPKVIGNSVGLDTAACHGNALTSICHETGEIFSVKSKEDYFGKLKLDL